MFEPPNPAENLRQIYARELPAFKVDILVILGEFFPNGTPLSLSTNLIEKIGAFISENLASKLAATRHGTEQSSASDEPSTPPGDYRGESHPPAKRRRVDAPGHAGSTLRQGASSPLTLSSQEDQHLQSWVTIPDGQDQDATGGNAICPACSLTPTVCNCFWGYPPAP